MKWKALIVLFAIGIGMFIPPGLSMIACHDAQSSIGNLDVCRSATPALFSNGEMPCVNECAFNTRPLSQCMASDILNPTFQPFFIAFQDERPPKS